ncbi:MAG: hypothetical protein ABIN36_12840 [Ferruginibacter sp.]
MKTILKRKARFAFILFGFILFFLESCNKEKTADNPVTNKQQVAANGASFQRNNTKSTLSPEKILDWLNKQTKSEASNRNKFISDIQKYLDFTKLASQEWGDEEFMVSVPITSHVSRHCDGDRSTSYLVLFEDSKGGIRNGELAIATKDSGAIEGNQTILKDLYLKNDIGFYGTLKLVTFQDYKFLEQKFEGNLKYSESAYGRHNFTGEPCIHWYILHVEYYVGTGEIIDWYTIDLGCTACPPNAFCGQFNDYFDESGGGGGPSQANTQTVNMFGEHAPPGYNDYDVSATYTIQGVRNNPRSTSTFTAVTLNPNSTSTTYTAGTGTYYWFNLSLLSNNEVINNLLGTATCTMDCSLTYFNQGNTVKVKSGYHIFTADII